MAEAPRRFTAPDGVAWEAEVISHGRTSGYLNPRVHRPVVEFRPDGAGSRRYAPLPAAARRLEDLDEAGLLELFARAKAH